MHEFLLALRDVNLGKLPVEKTEFRNFIKCKKIEDFAYEYLITDEGHPNFKNINILRENGFPVYPGEQDSFGWLTGCIKTKKGTLVFG